MKTLSKIASGILALIVLSIIFTGCSKKGSPAPTGPAEYVVSTLAGNGVRGNANGSGTNTSFSGPFGLAIDASGNLYVADYNNSLIRKITPDGTVTTFAGNGQQVTIPGTGTAASIAYPDYITIDHSNNLYTIDMTGNIVKITPSGVVTIFASGLGPSSGLVADANNNIYVADVARGSIMKVTAAGAVSIFTGSGSPEQAPVDGTGTSATFRLPAGITIDASGNLFVGDVGVNQIRKITPAGVVTTIAGDGESKLKNGNGLAASFYYPGALAADREGNIYVSDYNNNVIRKITAGGDVTTLAGNGEHGYADGAAASAKFAGPYGIVINSNGDLFVADSNNNVIRKIAKK